MADYLSRDPLRDELAPVEEYRPKTINILQLYQAHLAYQATQKTFLDNQRTLNSTNDPSILIFNAPTPIPNELYPMSRDEVISDSESDEDDDIPIKNKPISHPKILNTQNISSSPQSIQTYKRPHKYKTRYQKKQQENKYFQNNLKTKLTQIPDPNALKPFNSEINTKYINDKNPHSIIEQQNEKIIKGKYNDPTYN